MLSAVIVLFLGTAGVSYAQLGSDAATTAQLIGTMSQAIEDSARMMRGSLCKPGHRLKPEQWHEIRRECVEPNVHHILTPQSEEVWRRCKDILYDICSERQYRQCELFLQMAKVYTKKDTEYIGKDFQYSGEKVYVVGKSLSQACMATGMREATQDPPSFTEILRQAREFQEKLASAVGVLSTMRNCYTQKLRSFGFRQPLGSDSLSFY